MIDMPTISELNVAVLQRIGDDIQHVAKVMRVAASMPLLSPILSLVTCCNELGLFRVARESRVVGWRTEQRKHDLVVYIFAFPDIAQRVRISEEIYNELTAVLQDIAVERPDIADPADIRRKGLAA